MKKALITLVVLGLLGGGAYGAYYYFYKDKETVQERVSSTSEDAVYVDSVATITGYGSGNGLQERYGGEIEPQATLEVKLDGDKKVKECFVKEGDEVKEGQRLFIYDTQEDEDNLAQAEIDLERLESDIEVSEKQIEQLEKAKKEASSDDQLTLTTEIMSLQTSIKKSEYEIKTKKLEMEQLRESIASATVNAEMGGIVQEINDPDQGDSYSSYYGSNDSAYITILAAGDFRVKGSANEQAINQNLVYEGMQVIVYSRVDASMSWKGVVSEVKTDSTEDSNSESMYYYSMGSSSGSSSYAFYVDLESSDGLILGQHVYMEEDLGQDEKKDGLWLEEYYIFNENDKSYVWKANASNLLEKQEVTLGEYDDELMKYEITDGLSAEDYIAYPMETIQEGSPVIYNDYSMTSDDMYTDEGIYDDDEFMDDGIYEDDAEFMDEGVYDDEFMDEGVYEEDAGFMDDGVYTEDAGFSNTFG